MVNERVSWKCFILSEYVSEKMSEQNRFATELTPQEIEKRGLQRHSVQLWGNCQSSSSISSFIPPSSQPVVSFKRGTWRARKPIPSAIQVLQLYQRQVYNNFGRNVCKLLSRVFELCYFHHNDFFTQRRRCHSLQSVVWSFSFGADVDSSCLPEPNKINMSSPGS